MGKVKEVGFYIYIFFYCAFAEGEPVKCIYFWFLQVLTCLDLVVWPLSLCSSILLWMMDSETSTALWRLWVFIALTYNPFLYVSQNIGFLPFLHWLLPWVLYYQVFGRCCWTDHSVGGGLSNLWMWAATGNQCKDVNSYDTCPFGWSEISCTAALLIIWRGLIAHTGMFWNEKCLDKEAAYSESYGLIWTLVDHLAFRRCEKQIFCLKDEGGQWS